MRSSAFRPKSGAYQNPEQGWRTRSGRGFDENLLRIITTYGERRRLKFSLRFGRHGPVSHLDLTGKRFAPDFSIPAD